MIHSHETIDHLRKLLIKSGISDRDTLEEMIDHYLSDIEKQIAQDINLDVAAQSTYQKILRSDLSTLHNAVSVKKALAIAVLSALCLGLCIYLLDTSAQSTASRDYIEDLAPDGWPLQEPTAHITANFGLRMHPILKTTKHHNGVDIKAKTCTPVIATGQGIVVEIGYSIRSGNYVIIKHNDRYTTRYCHLAMINVDEHNIIKKGSIIGSVGTTGMSTASHLHYELIDGDLHIDPLECVRA